MDPCCHQPDLHERLDDIMSYYHVDEYYRQRPPWDPPQDGLLGDERKPEGCE